MTVHVNLLKLERINVNPIVLHSDNFHHSIRTHIE
jgi:hypothetical protein